MLTELSDEDIEDRTGVQVAAENTEFIKRKNELRALERQVINRIINLGSGAPKDFKEINTLLRRRRSLRLLMEEKVAKTRTDPRWPENRRVARRRTECRCNELRHITPRKCSKLRQAGHRSSKPLSIQIQRSESVRVQQVKQQWTEIQQVEQEAQITKLQVTPQWVDCVLLETPQGTPVLLAPVETAQPRYAELQTEVTVVKKIRIYEEIIEG